MHRSSVKPVKNIPVPPFYGPKCIKKIEPDKIFQYINELSLFHGRWQFKRRSEKEYAKLLKNTIYPLYEKLKRECIKEKLLVPMAVYGYFKCQSKGNDLIVCKQNRAIRFSFPRQKKSPFLCISDFFSPSETGRMDLIAFQLVTAGGRIGKRSEELFKKDKYTEYFYLHGLSVQYTEALAKYFHNKIREELNIKKGTRFSFGYSACPNLEYQKQLFELLNPKCIEVSLTRQYQMVPEQSTSAIIVHHPSAKWFNV